MALAIVYREKIPRDWSSADDQKDLILFTVAGLSTTVFWQDILLWHMRRRKNSCLCRVHEHSRVPTPSVLLLKLDLTAYNFKVVIFVLFFPQLNLSFHCISIFHFHHHGRERLIDSVLVDLCDSFSIHTVTSHNNSPSIGEVLLFTLAYWPSALSPVPLQSH